MSFPSAVDPIVIGETHEGHPIIIDTESKGIPLEFGVGKHRGILEAAIEQVAKERQFFRGRFDHVVTVQAAGIPVDVIQTKRSKLTRTWRTVKMAGETLLVPFVTPPKNETQLTLTFRGRRVIGVLPGVRHRREFPSGIMGGKPNEASLRQFWRDHACVQALPGMKVLPLPARRDDWPAEPQWHAQACRNFHL